MSKKDILILILIVVILGTGCLIYKSISNLSFFKPYESNLSVIPEKKVLVDPLNSTYTIEEQRITLVNGKSEQEIIPGSTSKLKTTVFGEPVVGDLNDDRINDAALILTQNSGGSGTFYYVVAAIQKTKNGKSFGTNGILLGDRIALQNALIDNGTIVVNYADRKNDESMTIQPSVGITKYFGAREDINGNQLVFEKANTEKFNEYLKETYLAKLPVAAKFDPSGIIKTTSFILGEQFCVSLSIKKDISKGAFATEIYDINTGQDIQPKGIFPQELKQGGSVGCEDLRYSIGIYEYRFYIDDILVAVLPFEVK